MLTDIEIQNEIKHLTEKIMSRKVLVAEYCAFLIPLIKNFGIKSNGSNPGDPQPGEIILACPGEGFTFIHSWDAMDEGGRLKILYHTKCEDAIGNLVFDVESELKEFPVDSCTVRVFKELDWVHKFSLILEKQDTFKAVMQNRKQARLAAEEKTRKLTDNLGALRKEAKRLGILVPA